VKSREGLLEILRTNSMQDHAFPKNEVSQKQCFLFNSKLNKITLSSKLLRISKFKHLPIAE
jgi:hypothetical protein